MTRHANDDERAERREAIRKGLSEGASQRAIARALGISHRTVQKEIADMRADDTPPGRHLTNAAPVSPTGTRAVRLVKRGGASALYTGAGLPTILPPPDYLNRWQFISSSETDWERLNAEELVSFLINTSPEVSRAVWDYQLLLNSGHEIDVYQPGTTDIHPQGTAALDAFIERLSEYHGSLKALAARLFMGPIMRGAFLAELVLSDDGRTPVDIATPDPATVRFMQVDDPTRGTVWKPGQWQDGRFVLFNSPTVRYVPIHPEPDNPYGRPMLGTAIFPAVFIIGLLHDLRRVVAQQGWTRTHVQVKLDSLRAAYRSLDDAAFEEKVGGVIEQIERELADLQPDDAYVTTDSVDVLRADGAVDASSLGGAGALLDTLERMTVRALKSTNVMMGVADAGSEARANREWEIFGDGVKTIQHYAEAIFEQLFEIALRVQGIDANVRMRFAAFRTADKLRDEQADSLRIRNAIEAERAGYIDANEAAQRAVGHDATGVRLGDPLDGGAADDAVVLVAEPGENRAYTRAADDDSLSAGYRSARDAQIAGIMRTWESVFGGTKYAGLLNAEVVNADE